MDNMISLKTMPVDAGIDPTNIPERPMSRSQLEWWVLFGICVANKPAKVTERKMRAFMEMGSMTLPPFDAVQVMIEEGKLGRNLRKARFGQYTRINRAFRHAVRLDVGNLSVEVLEAVPGIGPKTARMIMLYSRPGVEAVPLDTHVLKFLRSLGHKASASTPAAGPTYRRLESAFIAEARRRHVSVRELDTQVWTSYAQYSDDLPKLK